MSAQDIFGIVAILYCVANLGSMGLELNLTETMKALRSVRLVILTLIWSWIIGPLLAILIIKFLPLSEAHCTCKLI
jgi:predicted Na+-dependent transporter